MARCDNAMDATKNSAQKMSPSLKRLIKTFSWSDSFRTLHPNLNTYSRYYESEKHGEGATQLDRQYHWGEVKILSAKYIGAAFSDHLTLVLRLKVPTSFSKLLSPKYRSVYKSKSELIKDMDMEFNIRLKQSMLE